MYRATPYTKGLFLSDLNQRSLAVFVDYENFALGAGGSKRRGSSSKHNRPNMRAVVNRLMDKGRITVKRAYCDWQRFKYDITPLHELGIELIEIPDRSSTGKNSADIRLAVDAVEMCLTKEHIDTFAILSGDSDFSPLVAKLKEFGKTVIGIGAKPITSTLLVEVCDEFIFYEDILAQEGIPDYKDKVPPEKHECYQLLLETIDALQRDNESAIFASHLKLTMIRKRPEFSERSYGYHCFSALLEEAARLHLIDIHPGDRKGSVMIDGFSEQ